LTLNQSRLIQTVPSFIDNSQTNSLWIAATFQYDATSTCMFLKATTGFTFQKKIAHCYKKKN